MSDDTLRENLTMRAQLRELTAEITRLRARIEELERELEAHRAAAPVHLQTMRDMRARIEELEREIKRYGELAIFGHWITDEMIDKAWVRANQSLNIGRAQYDDGLGTLEELGIVACEKCGGHGSWEYQCDCQEVESVVTHKAYCAACQEHGWVRGNDDQ